MSYGCDSSVTLLEPDRGRKESFLSGNGDSKKLRSREEAISAIMQFIAENIYF
jgi:hypothetical protein